MSIWKVFTNSFLLACTKTVVCIPNKYYHNNYFTDHDDWFGSNVDNPYDSEDDEEIDRNVNDERKDF